MITEAPMVFIVDDDPSVCKATKRLLNAEGFAVRTFSRPDDVFTHGRPSGPCCLILDVHLPGGDGISFYNQLVKSGTRVPAVFITGYGDILSSVRAMKLGAVDFLPKPFRPEELVSCVIAALELDERSLSIRKRDKEIRERYQSLTPREREIFTAVAAGMPNKLVGSQCGICEKTVKVHRARVMEKMAAKTLAALVRLADSLGLPCDSPTERPTEPSSPARRLQFRTRPTLDQRPISSRAIH